MKDFIVQLVRLMDKFGEENLLLIIEDKNMYLLYLGNSEAFRVSDFYKLKSSEAIDICDTLNIHWKRF